MIPSVAITGATGLVGKSLVASLSRDPFPGQRRVLALTRDPRRAPTELAPYAVQWPPTDLGDPGGAIVHLLGESVAGRWSAAKKRAILESRVEGTRILVDRVASLAPSERPRVLVSASAIGYYGGDRGEEVLDEASPPGSGFLSEVCRAWENEARRAMDLGVRVVLARIGIVLAPQGGALERMLPIFRFGGGGPLGTGRQHWPIVHLDDVVGLLRWAMAQPIEGPINVVAESVRQADFARALGRALGRPTVVPTPAWALKVALGEFSSELLDSRRVVPRHALHSGYVFARPTLERCLDGL